MANVSNMGGVGWAFARWLRRVEAGMVVVVVVGDWVLIMKVDDGGYCRQVVVA